MNYQVETQVFIEALAELFFYRRKHANFYNFVLQMKHISAAARAKQVNY